jgi:hypothetical protein
MLKISDRSRLRGIVATLLLVVGGIALVVASTGWWLERNFLDTSRFTGTANELLDQDEVQAELSSVLVRQLSEEAGTDLQIAQPFLASIVGQVVESDAFRTVFDAALSNAHRVLVDRGTETIILDLTSAYDQIKDPLAQVAPKLARELPSRKQLEVVLLHRSELTTVWDTIDEVKNAVLLVSIASALLLAAGVAVAVERWRALARGAWIVAASGAVLVLALFVARAVIRSEISDAQLEDAIVASYRVITTPLLVQSAIVVLLAVVVGMAARFTATAGLPAWRPAAHTAWTRLAGAVPLDGAEPAVARLRLPGPRVDSRVVRLVRAAALAGAGAFAVFEPTGVASALVVLGGILLLVLAVLEAIAAWNVPPAARERPSTR